MKAIILFIFLALCGCTILTIPPVKPVDLGSVKITHCHPGLFQTHAICSEIRGQSKYWFPWVVLLGCTVKYYDASGVAHAVIYADSDLVKQHELDHIRGWDDGTERFERAETSEVARIMKAVNDSLAQYSDECEELLLNY